MLRWILILAGCVGLSTTVAVRQTQPPGQASERPSRLGPSTGDVNDYSPTTVIRKAIRPITDAPVADADGVELVNEDLVIGVVVEGHARAYPINQLTGPFREIINDVIGNTAIAATW